MDLSFLDKSSGITPLLVQLYDSHKLYKLTTDEKPSARAELISAISELLNMELSPRETELIADVMTALLRQAEKDLRAALSEHLSVMDAAPLRIVLQIANDDIEVAAPMLRNSAVLGDLDLLYIIKSKGAQYWKEIAARKEMSEHIVNVLAETKDFDTALALVKNKSIKISEHALGVLSDVAQGHEDLAQPLLRRPEITSDIATALYEYVGEELKSYIDQKFDVKTAFNISSAIDEIVLELSDAAAGEDARPDEKTLGDASRHKRKGLLTVEMMLGSLKRGQIKTFVAQMSSYTDLSADDMMEIIKQQSGQGLAIIAKAYNISKQDFMSLYLLTNRFRNEGQMIDVGNMNKVAQYYDRITEDVAREIISNSSGGSADIN